MLFEKFSKILGDIMFRIDEKFKTHKKQYVFQTFIVILVLSVIFSFLDFVFHISIVAALGASAFITFTSPFKELAKGRYLIGGYTVGCISGFLVSNLQDFFLNFYCIDIPTGILGAFAVGLAMFFMVILDFEHPPAAGVALGLVIDGFRFDSALIAIMGVIFFVSVRKLLSKYLIDLL